MNNPNFHFATRREERKGEEEEGGKEEEENKEEEQGEQEEEMILSYLVLEEPTLDETLDFDEFVYIPSVYVLIFTVYLKQELR